EGADAFVQNLAPGAAERLGLGAEVLTSRYPRLIICDISGYGSSGPYRDKKAYDLLVQCETGLVSVTGTTETPAKVGISAANIAPYGPFHAGDGKQVNLGIQNEREWAQFCSIVLERPEVATDPRFASNVQRVAKREALHAVIDAVFSQLTVEQVIARLDRAQIANARLNSMPEFWEHPQLAARQRWREVGSPV